MWWMNLGARNSHKVRIARDGGAAFGHGSPARVSCGRFATYAFRCIAGMHWPTPGMIQRSRTLDATPSAGRDTKSGPLVESDQAEVAALAARLVAHEKDPERIVQALYDHVEQLRTGEEAGALESLRAESGSEAGKARLLVALCRSQQIPCRVVVGLVLADAPNRYVIGQKPGSSITGCRWILCALEPRKSAMTIWCSTWDDRSARNARDSPSPSSSPICIIPRPGRRTRRPGHSAWRRMSLANLRPEEQTWSNSCCCCLWVA